jgi:hypothetical protein
MKKFLLISLIGFALVGCGEKDVTEAMLIGDWECSGSLQKAEWKNGKFQDYLPEVEHEELLVTYSKEGDNLFVKMPYIKEKIPQNIKKMNENYDISVSDMRIVGSNKLEYISDDEYKLTFEATSTQKESEYNNKTKVLMHCTRMK